ncbi:hypothetical protein [Dyella psychrodurans]|uniref:hypothetical protein n=1 Tax=Dyella psychrodurans TaxID=1927960 RepID=UPI001F26F36A|nr:hypothetical protein [Dyella psychrodurans]
MKKLDQPDPGNLARGPMLIGFMMAALGVPCPLVGSSYFPAGRISRGSAMKKVDA